MTVGVVIVCAATTSQILGGVWVGKTNASIEKQLKFALLAAGISVIRLGSQRFVFDHKHFLHKFSHD